MENVDQRGLGGEGSSQVSPATILILFLIFLTVTAFELSHDTGTDRDCTGKGTTTVQFIHEPYHK